MHGGSGGEAAREAAERRRLIAAVLAGVAERLALARRSIGNGDDAAADAALRAALERMAGLRLSLSPSEQGLAEALGRLETRTEATRGTAPAPLRAAALGDLLAAVRALAAGWEVPPPPESA